MALASVAASLPRAFLRPVRPAILVLSLLVCPSAAFDWGFFSRESEQPHAADELDSANFKSYLERNPATAILFYAPWCFHSQQMMPQWELTGQKLQLHDPPVHVAKVNTHRFQDIGEEYGITAFPTIKFFIDGSVFDYDDTRGRSWQQIVNWVNRHLDRDHILQTQQEVDDFLHSNDLAVLGLFPDNVSESPVAKSSRHYDDVMFAEVKSPDAVKMAANIAQHASLMCETIHAGPSVTNSKKVLMPRAGMSCDGKPRNPQRPEWTDRFSTEVDGDSLVVRRTDAGSGWQQHLSFKCCDQEGEAGTRKYQVSVPSVVMFMPHDERFAIYDGPMNDFKALDKWIAERRTPIVIQLNDETAETVIEKGIGKDRVLFYIDGSESQSHAAVVREAAKRLRGRIIVCFAGVSSRIERRLLELAGASEEDAPLVTILDGKNHGHQNLKKFRLPTNGFGDASSVVQFVEDHDDGKLAPYMKSEPVPSAEERVLNHVWILVGTTFKAFVEDENHDVLVDFYAPWCGHCRKFEPQYKALAKKLHHVKSLRVAKLDATRNELEGISLMGFPTILLFPAGKKPTSQYKGNRQPEDMVRWLHDHCTIPFSEEAPKEDESREPESGLLDATEEDL